VEWKSGCGCVGKGSFLRAFNHTQEVNGDKEFDWEEVVVKDEQNGCANETRIRWEIP
jgi:hypothetical protein